MHDDGPHDGVFQVRWDSSPFDGTHYVLTEILPSGQHRLVATFDQGRHTTKLEVAQWLTRTMLKGWVPVTR